MKLEKFSFALALAISVSILYAAYGLLLYYMPDYSMMFSNLMFLKDATLIGVSSLSTLLMSVVQKFVMVFIFGLLFSFIFNHHCCSEHKR